MYWVSFIGLVAIGNFILLSRPKDFDDHILVGALACFFVAFSVEPVLTHYRADGVLGLLHGTTIFFIAVAGVTVLTHAWYCKKTDIKPIWAL